MTGIHMIKVSGFLCMLLSGICLADVSQAEDRLGPVVDLTLQKDTNKPISSATAKAFGLGDGEVPAMQLWFLPSKETQVRFFGMSLRNTNDLLMSLVDKNTRTGTSWLTSRTGEIRSTCEVKSNGTREGVPNERHAVEFAAEI